MGIGGGSTGGDGAGAPTIHSAMTLLPIHTGRVIAIKLAMTKDAHTHSSKPTSLAANHLGLT